MTKAILTICLFGLFLLPLRAICQTVGIGEVTSIEAKVATYQENQAKIERYKTELVTLEAASKSKIAKLNEELAALYKERDDIIADMKVGAKCSQCGKYKSEFEKEGKSFQQHLGEVKGYAIPATTAELEATRKKYTEKIALKKVQIQNLEKGDNAVNQKKTDIVNLEKANETLCGQITAHSKDYETRVFADGKAKHENWTADLMNYAINILIADDKITINKARIVRYDREFQKEKETIRERVKKDNLDAQNAKNAAIVVNQKKIEGIQTEQTDYLAPLKADLKDLQTKRDETRRKLAGTTLKDSTRTSLTATLNQLVAQITALDKNILNYNTGVNAKTTALVNENKKLKSEIFQLNVDLPKQQDAEIAKAKPAYDRKKLEASQAVSAANTALLGAKSTYTLQARAYGTKNQDLVALIVSESNRMVLAAQKVNCPVYNDTRFKVMGNWNQVFPCVNAITTLTKPYSTNAFNSYCAGKSAATYMSGYKSFLNGLNEDDKEAVKGNSNADWFNLMTQ